MAIINNMVLPDQAPPKSVDGLSAWLRTNLFSGPVNSVATIVLIYLIFIALKPIIEWAFINAYWNGTSREDCQKGGACWVFVSVWIKQFIFGFYPEDQRWRVVLAMLLLVGLMIPLFIPSFRHKTKLGAFLLTGYPIITFILLSGSFNLKHIETSLWGGLMLTLVLALVGIVVSMPIGILLALGRRSNMPIVRSLCIIFIEFWRGVPLITVLFMASVMIPLFLPEGLTFDKLLRALIGIVFFESAYMAEVVRSGLQAIPKGQYEAGQAMGLSFWQSTRLVILPQALKLVIPGIVNTFIALFKDTSLVLIIGLLDFLAIVQSAARDSNWLGYDIEGYVFAAAAYWVFCFGMSRYSISLEKKLNTGHKR